MNSISSLSASPLPQSMKINTTSSTSSITKTDTTASTSTTEATISTQWGFKVDENGYFGADFNAAAGIPSNVKINQKTLETVAKSMQVLGSSQDPVSALGTAWNNFTKIAGNSLDSDGSMNASQVMNMPISYTVDSSIFGNVVSVKKTLEQYLKNQEAIGVVNTLSDGAFYPVDWTFFGHYSSYGEDSDGKAFDAMSFLKDSLKDMGITTDEGNANKNEISVGNLFNYFVGNMAPQDETDMIYVKATQAYFDFTQSGQSIEDYAKSNFGEDFFNEAMKGYGMTADKKFSQELVDLLLKEVNAQIKQDGQSYKAILESQQTPSSSTNSFTSKQYLSLTDITLLSGSLLSIGS